MTKEMIKEYSELICDWISSHQEFKVAAMCTKAGINPANMYTYMKKREIPVKHIPAINAILVNYGFLEGNPVMERNAECVFDETRIKERIKELEATGTGGIGTSLDELPKQEDVLPQHVSQNKPHKSPKKAKDRGIAAQRGDLPGKRPQSEPQALLLTGSLPTPGYIQEMIDEYGGDETDRLKTMRIAELEKEIANPPKELTPLAKKAYMFDRKKELETLK